MKLRNQSERFLINFDNKELTIPKGVIEVSQELGQFILSKASKWGFDVREENSLKITEIREIKEEVVKEVTDDKNKTAETKEVVKK